MKIMIRSVADKGNIEKERLVLDVASDADIGDYVLLNTGYLDDSVTTGVRDTFWFAYKNLSKGDLVVVYTKSGTNQERVRENGVTAHFYYWGLDYPIWNKKNSAAVILYAPEWESKGPDEL